MELQTYLYSIVIVLAAYVIGSIPTGFILVKSITGQDIRQHGSGSTGATNVKRILGKKGFFTVMFIDALKGALPVAGAKVLEAKLGLFPTLNIITVLVSVAVIIGHSKSVFLNFTGGKSVASGVGTIFGLNLYAGLITAIIWSVITYTTKYVSAGSIVAVMLTALWMYLFKQPVSYILYCLLGGLYIVYLHRENVKRLLSGTESKVR